MLDSCVVYIINNQTESFFSFVSEIFNQRPSSNTIILELGSQMIELTDMTKYETKDYKLGLTKKYNKLIPLYLDFKAIPSINSIYFLLDKPEFNSDPYTCEYADSNSNPMFTIKEVKTNKSHSKYQVSWNEKIIERDLLIYLLEWIFVKN